MRAYHACIQAQTAEGKLAVADIPECFGAEDSNAKLIAAAPQLLEALRNLDDFCRLAVDAGQLHPDEVEWRLIESREALAAAREEAKP